MVCIASALTVDATAATPEANAMLDAARDTVEALEGSPYRTQFRAAIERADAVIILPHGPPTRTGAQGTGRPAVAVVRGGAGSGWSSPAFYRVHAPGDNTAANAAGAVLTVMSADALGALMAGSVDLGGEGGLRVISVTTGINSGVQVTATADILAFVDVVRGQIGPSAFDGWRLTTDQNVNTRLYGRGSTPEIILSNTPVRDPGAEKLIGGLRLSVGNETSR